MAASAADRAAPSATAVEMRKARLGACVQDSLRDDLLAWYARHRRDLPWRGYSDPFSVWVAEVMLQQTRADTVAQRIDDFLVRFPTVRSLAEASPQAVCEAWAGLGYYRRALNLHEGARQVVARHGGKVPATVADLRRLAGIGPYTAGAIASIAFDACEPAVDVNATRVLSRVFRIAEPAKEAHRLRSIAAELVQCEIPGDLNQALMDLGATVCTPRHPDCGTCPIRSCCRAWREQVVDRIPAAAGRRQSKTRTHLAFAWVQGSRGGVWLEQRALAGLWAGLWEPPSAEGSSASRARAGLRRKLGVPMGRACVTLAHELTHRSVTGRLYVPEAGTRLRSGRGRRLACDPLQYPLSSIARRVIEAGLLHLRG